VVRRRSALVNAVLAQRDMREGRGQAELASHAPTGESPTLASGDALAVLRDIRETLDRIESKLPDSNG
jgi:hypothetical protein